MPMPTTTWASRHVGQGQLAEAALCFEQALTIDPRHRMAPWNRGCLRLLQGDFERGWPDYEQRWAQPGNAPRSFEQPRWDGSNLEGKTILVYAEQGLGDTIQFARYLPLVKERGGTIIFECQPSLLSLMAGSWGRKEGLQPGEKQGRLENGTTVEQVIAAGTALPAFDVHIPLLSLPLLFGTKPDTIPAQVPYLTADAKLVKHWRRDLDLGVSISPMRPIGPIRLIPLSPLSTRHSPLKVGIIWQGSMNQKGDRRSLPLIHFESLARVKGVQLTSLQVGPGTGQIAAATFPITDLGSRFNPRFPGGPGGGDDELGPGHHRGHSRGTPGRRPGRARLDFAAIRPGLALAAGSVRTKVQLVSGHMRPVSPKPAGRLGRSVGKDGKGASVAFGVARHAQNIERHAASGHRLSLSGYYVHHRRDVRLGRAGIIKTATWRRHNLSTGGFSRRIPNTPMHKTTWASPFMPARAQTSAPAIACYRQTLS